MRIRVFRVKDLRFEVRILGFTVKGECERVEGISKGYRILGIGHRVRTKCVRQSRKLLTAQREFPGFLGWFKASSLHHAAIARETLRLLDSWPESASTSYCYSSDAKSSTPPLQSLCSPCTLQNSTHAVDHEKFGGSVPWGK